MPEPLVILAAGSLRAALTDYAERWDGDAPALAFGPAGLLRQEIERGRPCDIYLSANTAHPQALAQAATVPWRAFAANPIRADWRALGDTEGRLPPLPDYALLTDQATEERPLQVVAAPARQFLNSSSNRTDDDVVSKGLERISAARIPTTS